MPTDKGANAGLKLSSLVAGMAAGADSIEDMALLRHGGMGKVFTGAYAPSTLGSFLRSFTFGHVRQADAVASRFLLNLAEHTELLGRGEDAGTVLLDIDDTIIEVHGYAKQGAAFGYSGVRGLNALLATVSTDQVAPVIAAQRLRKGSVGSPRGAARLAADALALIRRSRLAGRDVLVRADSAFYSHALVAAVLSAGAEVSITVRIDPAVKRAITASARTCGPRSSTPTRSTTRPPAPGFPRPRSPRSRSPPSPRRRRPTHSRAADRPAHPGLNPQAEHGQEALFDTWRFHAFFTTTAPEPSTRSPRTRPTAGTRSSRTSTPTSRPPPWPTCPRGVQRQRRLAGLRRHGLQPHPRRRDPDETPALARARRDDPAQAHYVPARIATSARRIHLHLPSRWPWQAAWSALYDALFTRPVSTVT